MMSKRTLAVLAFAVAGLGACSTTPFRHRMETPPPPSPPPGSLETHTVVAPSAAELPKGCVDQACARKVQGSHRQYFDQRRKRYYFYDPARRAYFWEDGEPKG